MKSLGMRPFPSSDARVRYGRLDISCKIETSTGWLELNDNINFRLEASAFGERQVTWRRKEVSGDFVDGTFVISAVRENVNETLAVYISGATAADHAVLRKRLEDALGQLSYRMMLRVGDIATYWSCSPADYTISSPRELLHSRQCLLRATVPRYPIDEVLLASGDEV